MSVHNTGAYEGAYEGAEDGQTAEGKLLIESIMKVLMREHGGVRPPGLAPPSGNEREAQHAMDILAKR